MAEIMKRESTNLMQFTNFESALAWGKMIAESSFCPKEFKNKTGDVLVAIQYGQELGLQPMQALQNICVINGKPSLYGDAMLAVCRASPIFEYCNETFDESTQTAICAVKRKGEPEQVRTFSKKDAEAAGLWSRPMYKNYGKRMLQMRARGFGLRDMFADLLKGMYIYEEMVDAIVEKDITPPAPKESPKVVSLGEVVDDTISEGTYKSLCFVKEILNASLKTQEEKDEFEKDMQKCLEKAGVTELNKIKEKTAKALIAKIEKRINNLDAENQEQATQWDKAS